MIQKCKITYHNKFLNIVVFEFKGKEIQITLDVPEGTKVVYIKYEMVNILLCLNRNITILKFPREMFRKQ